MGLCLGEEVTDTHWLKETEKPVISLIILEREEVNVERHRKRRPKQALQTPGRDLALNVLTPFRIASLPSSRSSQGSCGRSSHKSIVVTQNGPPSHPVTSASLTPLLYHILLFYFCKVFLII